MSKKIVRLTESDLVKIIKQIINEETSCKDGEYFVGTKKMTEQQVKDLMKKNQEPFSGSKCIGGKKTQVTCQNEGGKLKCTEAVD
jgi:hypothetical protein